MNEPAIQQHALRNAVGRPVNFDIHQWGNVYNYDISKAHRHKFHEILVFEAGTAKHDIDFTTYAATAGSVHFVASDNVHLLMREPDSAGYSLLFTNDYFSADILAQLPFSKNIPVLHLYAPEFETLNNIARQIKTEYESGRPFADKMVRSLAEVYLLHLLRAYQTVTDNAAQATVPTHIAAFRQLLKDNILNHYSVDMYAEKLSISTKHLIALSKKHTGKTPLKHIQEQVVCEAKRQLFHTRLSIKEIAYMLNFDDPANFSKYFKSVAGYSPAAYRKGER